MLTQAQSKLDFQARTPRTLVVVGRSSTVLVCVDRLGILAAEFPDVLTNINSPSLLHGR